MSEMSKRVGEAVREAFARQRIDPWRGMDFSGVNPPVDWEAIGAAAIRETFSAAFDVVPVVPRGTKDGL